MHFENDEERQKFREQFSAQLKTVFHLQDTRGMEIFSALHRISHVGEMVAEQASGHADLSGPRWRLMLRLLMDEQRGDSQGLTPTDLSHWQRVSKNTVSALLRGLEDQGLIQRSLDAKDLRLFHIQLTPAGRELMMDIAPKRITGLNKMLSGLDAQEVEQLGVLLEKLQTSMMTQCSTQFHPPMEEETRN